MNTPTNPEALPPTNFSSSWVDFIGGSRMKLHKHLAIEVQQGKMPNSPWYWYGVGGISHAYQVGGYPTKKEAQLAAVEHARSELTAAVEALNEMTIPRESFGQTVRRIPSENKEITGA